VCGAVCVVLGVWCWVCGAGCSVLSVRLYIRVRPVVDLVEQSCAEVLLGLLYFCAHVLLGVSVGKAKLEAFLDLIERISLQTRQTCACACAEGAYLEQLQQLALMFSDGKVGLVASLFEVIHLITYHLHKLRRELDFELEHIFGISDVEHNAKVDVGYRSIATQQNVAVVPVLDVQNVAKD